MADAMSRRAPRRLRMLCRSRVRLGRDHREAILVAAAGVDFAVHAVVAGDPLHVIARLAKRDALDELVGCKRSELLLPTIDSTLSAVVRRQRLQHVAVETID